jgi:hypothetical protein
VFADGIAVGRIFKANAALAVRLAQWKMEMTNEAARRVVNYSRSAVSISARSVMWAKKP